ncbi:MAG: hypothetical protein CMJ84_10970 [Planctomycetes bacterium]|nr:hypothetical protein [Planctomycetota bacterium]MDP6409195.1 hypothetical protein [Planctomycetota bacterium]
MSTSALARLVVGSLVLVAVYLPPIVEFATQGPGPSSMPAAANPVAGAVAPPVAVPLPPLPAPVEEPGRPGF